MPSEIAVYRALVRAEGDRLLGQLAGLSPDDWSRPSACEGWDVLGVVIHLHLGTTFHTTMVRNTLDGRLEPAWADLGLPAGMTPYEYAGQLQAEAGARGPASNLLDLREALERYVAQLEVVTDADLDRMGWFYTGETPLRQIIAIRIFDIVLHATDVRRPLGIAPTFSPEGARFAGRATNYSLANFWKPELAEGAYGTIHQEVDGDEVHILVRPDGLGFAPPDSPFDASIATDGGTWALLTWRQLPLADAEAAGATIAGDRALLERFLGAIRTP